MRRSRLVVTLTRTAFGLLLLAGAGMAVSGCVSFKRTPGARYFVLRSLVEAKDPEVPVAGSVGLLPVRVAGALDRPQLVSWTAPNELRLDELQRWAEPLAEGVSRTLAENLAALLPGDRILRAPWPVAARPRCRVAAELGVFGLQPDGAVRLEASIVLLAPGEERVLARRAFAESRKPVAGGAAATVDAMSELVAALARQVAEAIAGLPAPAASSGPEARPFVP